MITGKNYIGDNLSSNSSLTLITFNQKLKYVSNQANIAY